jgi:hypothetical protein
MSTRAKKTRKPNRGSFKAGPDPRRHRFTCEERQRGYQTAMNGRDVNVIAWVLRRVRGY